MSSTIARSILRRFSVCAGLLLPWSRAAAPGADRSHARDAGHQRGNASGRNVRAISSASNAPADGQSEQALAAISDSDVEPDGSEDGCGAERAREHGPRRPAGGAAAALARESMARASVRPRGRCHRRRTSESSQAATACGAAACGAACNTATMDEL
jgi:hypothetical protein